MVSVFVWWLILLIVGLAAWPVAFRLFRNLPDRGYVWSKPLGLLLVGYAFWLLVTLRFLANTWTAIAFLIVILALISGRLFIKEREAMMTFWGEHRRVILSVEALFAVAFLVWTVFRALNPEIMGTEKPMEFAFLNAILRSEHFPPHDPWLSGFAISYYYFGYVIVAMLTRLSGIPSGITFNLAVASLFALTVIGAFGLVYNLIARKGDEKGPALRYAGLGAVLVAVIGNLEGLLEVLHAKGLGSERFWAWIDVPDLMSAPVTGSWLPPQGSWWWWRASRVIHDVVLGQSRTVIDEFPFFSFLLGDMHPHVLALPFGLLALGLALNLLRSGERFDLSRRRSFALLYPLCLGALGFLNAWDFPTYTGIAVAAYALQRRLARSAFDRKWFKEVVYAAALIGGIGLLIYAPFYISFQSQASGLRPVLLVKTRLAQYLVIFGTFAFVLLSFLSTRLQEWIVYRKGRGWFTSDLLVVMALGGSLAAISALFGWWTPFFLSLVVGLTVLILLDTIRMASPEAPEPALEAAPAAAPHTAISSNPVGELGNPISYGTLFVLLLIAVGFALTLSTEFVYIKDTFGNRMNTVFKFYYQAWVFLAISSAYAVYVLRNRWRGIARLAWSAGLTLFIAAGLIYPAAATYAKTGGFQGDPTLDGTAWYHETDPADYEAIQWVKVNVGDAPVLLEATGPQYWVSGYHNRVSVFTGLPTVLGWGGHELQWRGSYDEPGKREPDIKTIYQSLNVEQVQSLLDKYDVAYVYVGSVERQTYGLSQPQVEKFRLFMDVAFENQGVVIFKRS